MAANFPFLNDMTIWGLARVGDVDSAGFRDWLRQHGLLSDAEGCPSCGNAMHDEVRDDWWRWKCGHRNPSDCRNATKGMRVGSFFEHSHLDLRQALQLMYFWSAEIDKQDFVMEQIGIGSEHTVVDYKNFCREIPAQYFNDFPVVLGGPGMLVHIDESEVSHPKNWIGHGWATPARHVFGIFEEQGGQLYLAEVPNKRAVAIFPHIQQTVLAGTTLVSDGAAVYRGGVNAPPGLGIVNIRDPVTQAFMNYQHEWVNHRFNFVHPLTGATTNPIECMWRHSKAKQKRMNGTSGDLLASYMIEFMWRWNYARHRPAGTGRVFQALIECIRHQYPV